MNPGEDKDGAAQAPPRLPSRFDYVKYDERATEVQNAFKGQCSKMEAIIEKELEPGRAVSTALTKLEEFYMWVGKAIRDDQIARNGSAELQEERKDG